MPSALESLTDEALDPVTVEHLGDTFTYTPAGGSPSTGVYGFVDYGEEVANPMTPSPGVVSQTIVVELLASIFPDRPSDTCRISGLNRYPGAIYKPVGSAAFDRGFWRFSLQKVPA
jgi:hypothetical protein